MSGSAGGGDVWCLEFAGPLPSNDNTRRRWHWTERRERDAVWHNRVALAVRARHVPSCERIRLSVVVTRRSLGVADPDGDWGRMKPIIDGLVRSGVVPNDTYRHVILGEIQEQRGEPGLRVFIEPAPTGQE